MDPIISWALALLLSAFAVWYYRRPPIKSQAVSARISNLDNWKRSDPRIGLPADETRQQPKTARKTTAKEKWNKEPSVTRKKSLLRAQPVSDQVRTETDSDVEELENKDATGEQDLDWARRLQPRKGALPSTTSATIHGGVHRSYLEEATALPSGIASQSSQAEEPSRSPLPAFALDVADMMEMPSAAASVLRITGEAKARVQRSARATPAVETKKQRQNKRKAEQRKEAKAIDERERHELLEKQRRTAREARGESAKNGVSTIASTPNTWLAGDQTQGQSKTASPVLSDRRTQLLDTLDQDAFSATSSLEHNTSVTTPATAASTHEPDLPSEETQMQILHEMANDSAWNEVSKRKNKRKGVNAIATNPHSNTGTASPASMFATMPKADLGVSKEASEKMSTRPETQAVIETSPQSQHILAQSQDTQAHIKGHPDDSDWAVL